MKLSFVSVSLLVATTAFVVVGASACGGDDKESGEATPGKTPASTKPAAVSTLSPRTGDFASLCQKSGEEQFSAPLTMIDPARSYSAVIKTEKGDITVDLYAADAPVTVNSFVFLACKGFYDGVTWHRVLPGFVAQTGDPTGKGNGGPGYEIPDEINSRLFEKGALGMANRGPNTNGSQFFICFEPQPKLDGGYTVFGKVTAGMDVLGKITPRDPSTAANLPPGDKIVEIVVTEK